MICSKQKEDNIDLNVIIKGFETHLRLKVEQNHGNWNPKQDKVETLNPAETKQRL